MEEILINYYAADIKKSTALGRVSLKYMLNSIKNPKKDIKHIFEQIRIAEVNKDQATKQQLKTKLYSFTPCVFVEGPRKYTNIKHFNGILVLDFDHLESPEYAEEFKQYIFENYKFIISTWLSASRHGVRALVKIPVCQSVDEFKLYFNAIEDKLCQYIGFDTAPKNCILPLFISYDENLLMRDDATTWQIKTHRITQPSIQQYIIDDKTPLVNKIIKNKIDVITGNGHPQLRAAAYLFGGYVGAGYTDYLDAENFIISQIYSNAYLSQKASVYIQTAKTMLKKGMLQPTYLTKL